MRRELEFLDRSAKSMDFEFENCAGVRIGAVDSIPPEKSDQLALDAHTVGRKYPHFIGGVRRLKRDRRATAAEALESCFLIIDQRHHDVAGVGGFCAAN